MKEIAQKLRKCCVIDRLGCAMSSGRNDSQNIFLHWHRNLPEFFSNSAALYGPETQSRSSCTPSLTRIISLFWVFVPKRMRQNDCHCVPVWRSNRKSTQRDPAWLSRQAASLRDSELHKFGPWKLLLDAADVIERRQSANALHRITLNSGSTMMPYCGSAATITLLLVVHLVRHWRRNLVNR